jgi:hypothetical protein
MLTERFDFISRKDGVEVYGHCEKKNGRYRYYIDAEGPTTEHNGFRVEIPGLRPEKLSEDDLLDTFFIGYPKGTILINGKAPHRALDDEAQFTKLMEGESVVGWVSKESVEAKNRWDYYTGRVYGIVEDVVYEINSASGYAELHNVFRQYGRIVYLNIPNGSVKMTPSREALIYNDKTEGTIRRVLGEVKEVMEREVQQRISLASTRREALAVYAEEKKGKFWGTTLSYRGAEFPAVVTTQDGIYRLSREEGGSRNATPKNVLSKPTKFDLLEYAAMRPVIVTQKAETDGIDSLRRRFNAYRAAASESVKTVLFVHESATLDPWIEACAAEVITEDTYVEVARGEQLAARAARPKGQRNTKWHVLTNAPSFKSYDEESLAGKARILYITRDMNLGYGLMSGGIREGSHIFIGGEGKAILDTVGLTRADTAIIGISVATRLKAFLKAFPHAESVTDAAKAEAAKIAQRRDAAGVGGMMLRAALLNQDALRYRNATFTQYAKAVDLSTLTNPAHRELFTALAVEGADPTTDRENTVLKWASVKTETADQTNKRAEELARAVLDMPLFPSERVTFNRDGMVEHVTNYLNSIK